MFCYQSMITIGNTVLLLPILNRSHQFDFQFQCDSFITGVTLTSCTYDGPSPDCGGWGDSIQSDERGGSCGPSRRGSSSPQPLATQQHLHRASWHAPDTHTHM